MSRSDFRVRKYGDQFHVWQFEAGKWVPLWGEVYPSREAAEAAIDGFVAGDAP